MPKQLNLYLGQSTLKGKITQNSLSQEGFTDSWTAEIFDAFTGESRTLDATGPIVLTADPQNQKAKGIEEMIPGSWSVSSGTYTFLDTLRGLNLDAHDDAGSFANAKEWPVGTEFGITTSPQSQNYLKKLLEGVERFKNSLNFDADQNFLQDIKLVYKPAFLTGGASPTTAAATWAAITDGEFSIDIDGTTREMKGIDFTNIGNNDQVAAKIQTAIRAVTSGTEEVEWDGTQFIIQSNDTSSTSAITVTSTVAAPAGTDISGAGGTNFLDCDIGNGTVTSKALGQVQFKDSNNYIGMDVGETDLVFASDSQAEQTLSQLASLSGSNDKVKVSANDTTEDYLINQITGGDGITVSEINDGGDESLDIDVDTTDTTTFVKTSSGAGDEDKVPVLDTSGQLADGFINESLSSFEPGNFWKVAIRPLDDWSGGSVGGGSKTLSTSKDSVLFTTGASTNNLENFQRTFGAENPSAGGGGFLSARFSDLAAGQKVIFEANLQAAATNANAEIRFGIGQGINAEGSNEVTAKFRFTGTTTEVVTSDGVSASPTVNSITVSDINVNNRLRIEWTPDTSVVFKVNNVIVHTETTDFPTTASAVNIAFYAGIKTTTTASRTMRVGADPYIAIQKV